MYCLRQLSWLKTLRWVPLDQYLEICNRFHINVILKYSCYRRVLLMHLPDLVPGMKVFK